MKPSVPNGGRRVRYELHRTGRRTLEIAVHPDGRVVVTAPRDAATERVHARVQARASWIRAQLARFAEFRPFPTPRRYVPGETHRYLGRQYRLRVRRGRAESVRLEGGFLCVTTTAPRDRQRLRQLVDAWYLRRASEVLGERLAACLVRWRAAQLAAPTLAVRLMMRRWGSCSKRGRITLNVELMKVPTSCIDYVITHELCHLKAMHHRREFWQLLGRVMPDWEQRRARLDRQEV